jgi:hypothetical protein
MLALGLVIFSAPLLGESIKDSRHDLSTPDSTEVCIFCHVSHRANPDSGPPLWNRAIESDHFRMYSSDSMDSTMPSMPSPVSLLCLGCHDGVISEIAVNGVMVDNKHDLVNYHGGPDTASVPNCERCHGEMYTGKPSSLSLGTNLGNDHPISMDYPTSDPEFNTPSDGTTGWGAGKVRLAGGKVECVSATMFTTRLSLHS